VPATLAALRQSSANTRQKAKFILATDGQSFEAENLADGETVACACADFHDHFGFFLPLAGITTVKPIRENAFDIKATSRLNRLYIELLKDNPEWATDARREDLNHFMARLIFCFFVEDTAIFHGDRLFTGTIEQMTARDSSDTHLVPSELFRALNTRLAEREAANIRSWAHGFPNVNGGLFGRPGSADVPVGIFWKCRRGRRRSQRPPLQQNRPLPAPRPHPRLRSRLRLGKFPRHRLQRAAGHRGRNQPPARRRRAPLRHPSHQFSRHRVAPLLLRDRPPRPHHRRVSTRRALSRPKTRPARVPPARGHQLDHLWQRPPHRLAQRLPADGQGGKNRR
jgi:hypothetical protein